jgi:hypothetical protein
MAATASQVVAGLKTSLATISGLRTFSYQPSQIMPPVAFPVISQVRYHGTMGGGMPVYECVVYLIVGRYSDDRAMSDIDDYVAFTGAKSLRAALEADPTLGGVAQSVLVSTTTDITSVQQADAEFLQLATQLTVNG